MPKKPYVRSCRNCFHSRHEGTFTYDLVCQHIEGAANRPEQANKGICSRSTRSYVENLAWDQRCIDLAAACPVWAEDFRPDSLYRKKPV